MQVTTTRNKPKPFSWSYSKLKNFESCPKRHWHVDIQRDIKEEESDNILWGNTVHKALADRVAKGTPLPKGMENFEPWAQRILGDVTQPKATIFVEQKLALTKSFGACKFFDDTAWYRGIGDVIKIVGKVALIVDYKTGKIIEDGTQLALMAACVFAHYPEVQRVRSEFIWLKEDATTRADFTREGMTQFWRNVWPRIEALEHAAVTLSYPAKPGALCRRWCPVTVCPHHGE